MSNYIIAYIGGRPPKTPEEGAANKERWGAWVQGLGDAVVNPGTPLKGSKVVSSDGISDKDGSLTGYSVVKAANFEAALAMAQECPFLEYGTLEVAEMMEM